MRGKGQHIHERRVDQGITPAYAGKSISSILMNSMMLDHPRVCGEKQDIVAQSIFVLGSPPRMRGKDLRSDYSGNPQRITPAYAGKRLHHGQFAGCPWDYPRVCGEKNLAPEKGDTKKGSPPRMRGKEPNHHERKTGVRITPAYAGKRHKAVLSSGRYGDHPRVCGEKNILPLPFPSVWGSPPRMRGKVHLVEVRPSFFGITPAYAGKRCRERFLFTDH